MSAESELRAWARDLAASPESEVRDLRDRFDAVRRDPNVTEHRRAVATIYALATRARLRGEDVEHLLLTLHRRDQARGEIAVQPDYAAAIVAVVEASDDLKALAREMRVFAAFLQGRPRQDKVLRAVLATQVAAEALLQEDGDPVVAVREFVG
jgi:hypothetical protein